MGGVAVNVRPQDVPARPTPTIAAYDPDADVAAGKAALTLVPADATEVTR